MLEIACAPALAPDAAAATVSSADGEAEQPDQSQDDGDDEQPVDRERDTEDDERGSSDEQEPRLCDLEEPGDEAPVSPRL